MRGQTTRAPFRILVSAVAGLSGMLAAILTTPAAAQPQQAGAAAMLQAYQAWASANGIANSAMVISRDGVEIAAGNTGSWTPDTVAPIASTSKAITGMCILELQDQGRLALTDAVDRHISADFRNSLSATGRANATQITIEQLLRHTSGFQGNGNPTPPGEPTQAQYAAGAADAHPDQWFSRQALDRALLAPPGTAFAYANVNYALLSVIIEAVSGESYEAFCRRTVLTPNGAGNAAVASGNAAMGAFGGWSISARQYAAFYSRAFLRSALSEDSIDFMDRAFDPACSLCGYGPGVFVLPANYSLSIATLPAAGTQPFMVPVFHSDIPPYELNHNGDWSSSLTTPARFSSFAIFWPNGISAVMISDSGNIQGPLGNFYTAVSTPALSID